MRFKLFKERAEVEEVRVRSLRADLFEMKSSSDSTKSNKNSYDKLCTLYSTSGQQARQSQPPPSLEFVPVRQIILYPQKQTVPFQLNVCIRASSVIYTVYKHFAHNYLVSQNSRMLRDYLIKGNNSFKKQAPFILHPLHSSSLVLNIISKH